MRSWRTGLGAVATLWVLSALGVASERPTDKDISDQLIGKWTTCVKGGSESETDGTITFDKGGTFVAEGAVKLGGGEKAQVRVEGKWKVATGAVVMTVTKTTHPGIAPVGGQLKETILSIDEKMMKFKRGVGRERERKRVAD